METGRPCLMLHVPMQIYLNRKRKMRTFILLSFCFQSFGWDFFFFFYSLGILHLHTLLESYSLICALRRCFTLGIFDYVMRLKSIFRFNNIVLFSNPIFFMHWGDSSCKLCFASIWHWKYSWLFLFHLKNHTVVICLWCKYQPNHMTRLMHQDAWHRHGQRPIWILASERETHLSYLQLKQGWGGGGGIWMRTSPADIRLFILLCLRCFLKAGHEQSTFAMLIVIFKELCISNSHWRPVGWVVKSLLV